MSVAAEQVHVARQPILDARHQVFGYELLHRGSADAAAFTGNGQHASAQVIGDTLLAIGFETLTNGHRAFVNMASETLLSDASSVLDPEQVVLEILENVEVTPEVIAMCASLRKRGYELALDDFEPGSPAEALVPHAKFVKLDVLALAPMVLKETAARMLRQGVSVIAEKVETASDFERAKAAGCSLFQGYYFCRPTTFSAKSLSANQVAQMRLMAALYKPSVSLGAIEDLLKHDTSLTYRVLRTVNSAGFGLRREVRSIREALLMLGLDQIRKWTSIWVLSGMNKGPSELVTMTVLRGRSCELLGQHVGGSGSDGGYFLLGLCSLLDALLGLPMAEVVKELPLEDDLREALLGTVNRPRQVLDAVVHYEKGHWLEAAALESTLDLPDDALAMAYADALAWTRKLTSGAA
ncbi:MAG: EAL domain-containing protein [Acidobacteria bacterium]|nr:EAL domain-containing protein [Acidobacteriota bacterium]